MALVYTSKVDEVIEAEKKYIQKDHKNDSPNDEAEQQALFGLALSGGGIRSASFSLGIIQALVRGGVLKKMDYLSTASGGGYIGSALTWFLRQGLPGGASAGTDVKNFPLGRPRTGARNQADNPNAVLDYLRQHGCYLTPGNGLDMVSFLAYSIRTIFVSFLVYFSVLTLLLAALKIADFLFHPPFPLSSGVLAWLPNYYLLAALVTVALFITASIVYSLLTRVPLGSTALRYRLRVFNQLLLGLLVKWTGVFLVLASLPLIHDQLERLQVHIETASGSTLLGAVLGWLQYRREQKKTTEGMPKCSGTTSIVASVLIIYGLLLGAFILTEHIDRFETAETAGTYYLIWAAMLIFTALLGVCVNVNYAGLHRMYRDRLMEAFLPDATSVATNRWGFSEAADNALIENMCQTPNQRPYHIINTNIVLVDSDTAKYRGRGGDNFILSPLFCGSDATGWRRSSNYMKKNGRGMTLATAMAISGAALNPNAAVSGRGISRNRWVSVLHSLLNLRLGYWAVNPSHDSYRGFTPNFFVPSLTQSIIARGLKETRHVVELTDGGHFENLAIYELVRRRLKLIICCDGGADSRFSFDDLGNAIEKVRVDFGAKIVFDDPEWDLPHVLPGSSATEAVRDKYQTAKRGFAVASIYYADGSEGKLIYIKATMVEGLSTDIYSYKAACPEFPHQPTTDQFFDEVQVEAYRELGYYLGWDMLEANGKVNSGEKISEKTTGRWI